MALSENELKGLEETYSGMMSNPETRAELLRLIKKRFPERNIPEVEVSNAIDSKMSAELKKRDEEIAEMKKQILETDLRRQIEEKRNLLRKAPYNFDEEDISEVEKIVTEQGVNYEFAADHLRNKRIALRPSGYNGQPQRKPGDTSNWREELRKKDSTIRKDFDSWQNENFTTAYKEAFGE